MRTKSELEAVGIKMELGYCPEDENFRLVQERLTSDRGRVLIRYYVGKGKAQPINDYEVTIIRDKKAPLLKRLFLRRYAEQKIDHFRFDSYDKAESLAVETLRSRGYPQVGDKIEPLESKGNPQILG